MKWLLLFLFMPGGNQSDTGPFSEDIFRYWYPCHSVDVYVKYSNTDYSDTTTQENEYTLTVRIEAETVTLFLKFSSEVALEVYYHPDEAKVSVQKLADPKNSYGFIFSGKFHYFDLILKISRPASGAIPYLESVLRDYQEKCKNPDIGYLDKYFKQEEEKRLSPNNVDEACGRRKVIHTQLIVQGQSTKSGDWPWHVAILRVEKSSQKYICGGTLLSTTLVLTAAHCASIRGNAVVPEILSVYLGKHNLIGGDIGAQEREVFRVINHPKFDGLTQDNDIALLKLKSEAVITDYVQPACLWKPNKLPDSQHIFGTVVGWGFNHKDSLSSTLQEVTIPIIPELICLKSNPTFFHQRLNDNKFCAGFANGTSVCNGDSGGGLMIFVPDSAANINAASGAWYVRGIVSIAPRRSDAAICDPYEYTIFTDVEKYRNWLLQYME